MQLQSWIFAIKYLESASNADPKTTSCISHSILEGLLWGGTGLYTFGMVVLCTWMLVAFPGYVDSNGSSTTFNLFFMSTYQYIMNTTNSIWLCFTLFSTFISIYAIF